MGVKASEDIRKLKERIQGISIGVISSDFSFLHDLIVLSKARQIPLHVIDPTGAGDICLDCVILEADEDPPPDIRTRYRINRFPDAERTLEKAIFASMDRGGPDLLAIGIDPGKRPGVAFIADGRLVSVYRSSGDSGVAERVKMIVGSCDPRKVLVRIGDGAPPSRDNIITLLKKMDMKIEMVDERKTTISKRYRDEVAAIMIARAKC